MKALSHCCNADMYIGVTQWFVTSTGEKVPFYTTVFCSKCKEPCISVTVVSDFSFVGVSKLNE
jgi:hypothetical protein